MPPCLGEFLLRRGAGIGMVEDPAGRNPPVAIAVQIDVAAAIRTAVAKHVGGRRAAALSHPVGRPARSGRA